MRSPLDGVPDDALLAHALHDRRLAAYLLVARNAAGAKCSGEGAELRGPRRTTQLARPELPHIRLHRTIYCSLGVTKHPIARELDMEAIDIREKFGDDYVATEQTFRLGIDIRLTRRIAQRFQGRTVLETCTGGGFTTIPLAEVAAHVVTIEIDPEHLAQARANVMRARLQDRVTFVEGDALSDDLLAQIRGIDAALLDPDWAATGPTHVYRFRQSNMHPPADALLKKVLRKTDHVALILPPAIDLREIEGLPPHELQRIYLGASHALHCVYFGALAKTHGETELHA